MNAKNNAARVAVQAEPCQKQAASDCKRIFDVAHPEDVISPIRIAADALGWLEEVLKTIEAEAGSNARIKRLARMGAYLAADMSNLADCAYEDMLEAIKKGGAA